MLPGYLGFQAIFECYSGADNYRVASFPGDKLPCFRCLGETFSSPTLAEQSPSCCCCQASSYHCSLPPSPQPRGGCQEATSHSSARELSSHAETEMRGVELLLLPRAREAGSYYRAAANLLSLLVEESRSQTEK